MSGRSPVASGRVALVLDGHGWAARAVVRSLALAGWRVLAPAGTKAARSSYCSGAVRLPDYRKDAQAFVDSLRAAIAALGIRLVAPAEDASLELLYESPGLPGEAAVLGGSRESARLALDKEATLQRARQAGFATPDYHVVCDPGEALRAARDVGYPCVLKPTRSYARFCGGLRSARLVFAQNRRQLSDEVARFRRAGFQRLLLQSWVPGRSIGVAAVLHRGAVLGFGAREAFSQYPVRGGSAVWRATVKPSEPGVQDALELLRTVSFEGMGDVQYHIASDGTPKLMEIGARTYGWLPLTIAAGADLPRIAAEALEGRLPGAPVAASAGWHMRWPKGEALRFAEALAPRVRLPPRASRLDVLRQLSPLWGPRMLYDGIGSRDRRLRTGRRPPAYGA